MDLIRVEDASHDPSIARTVFFGLLAVVVMVGGGLIWAFMAQLDGAAVAQGAVVVDGNRKAVQHLEGGIVSEIMVKEGDSVTEGQVLFRMEGGDSRSKLQEISVQYWTNALRAVRLSAEKNGMRKMPLPKNLETIVGRSIHLKEAEAMQKASFSARWTAHDGELALLREQIRQAKDDVDKFRAEEKSAVEQILYAEEELAGIQELYDKGLERKPRLMSVKRFISEAVGKRDSARAAAARAQRQASVLELQISSAQEKRSAEISEEMEKVQGEMSQAAARMKAAKEEVVRTEIKAPAEGRIVGLKAFTIGGVVKPGDTVAEIVPQKETLVFDAKVNPMDIDVVHPGQEAHVRLTAYKQRNTPPISARVLNVSADRMVDQKTGEPYFVAKITPNAASMESLGPTVALYPGMPVEAFIVTGPRRAVDYILSPLRDSMKRAMVED